MWVFGNGSAASQCSDQSLSTLTAGITGEGSWVVAGQRSVWVVWGPVAALLGVCAAVGMYLVVGHARGRSGPPRDGGSYSSAQAVLAALSAAGVACTDPQPVANPTGPGTLDLLDCTSPGGQDEDTTVATFDTHAHAVASAQELLQLVQAGNAEVVGVDWVVNTTSGYAQTVVSVLGGQVMQAGATATAG
jgi:hypothetical protein